MRKLMTFCFIILFSVLSALSCFNFAFDALDRIERDKITIVIEKPESITNADFLAEIDCVLETVNADIMLRQVENVEGKAHYQYFKTGHTADFLSISTNANEPLKSGECISTTEPAGYTVYRLSASALMQDISFYPWADAGHHDLSAATYYVKMGQQSAVVDAIRQLGYGVTVNPTTYISGQFSVFLFGFVPSFMLVASMAFYVLSGGKKNVLKKMEGYTTRDVLADDAKDIFPVFAISFLVIETMTLIVAGALYQTALPQYMLFSLPNIAILIAVVLIGFVLSALLICRQNSAEHIKGRVPRRGIYFTTTFAKGVFVAFIIFFLSIAVRNATISYHTMQASRFIADKVEGYVTVPVNISNASTQNLAENYKAFYSATVEQYSGILVDSSNYEYNLISGRTPAEEFGQTSITVNRNYLDFNPIYDMNGMQITDEQLSASGFNVLLPASREREKENWSEFVQAAYGMEANFISYDEAASKIYSYNANTGTGDYGALDEPVILVIDEEQLEGIFVLSYCSKGAYFLKAPGQNAYTELLPILQEAGIASVTLETPSVASTFSETVNHQQQMLMLYGTQSAVLLIGLICLIVFSSKLYCENYKSKIACCLIEGYSMLRCIRKHLVVTVIYYAGVVVVLRFISMSMKVSLNYLLLLAAFAGEVAITLIVSREYTKNNLYQIVKGAE